jgi:redox-sensitive bicupin YhaK (pirin superfamily)
MDFNLIAIPSLKSELDGFKIEQGDGLNLELNELYEFILIFVFKGNVDLDKELSIKEGEVMVIHEVEKQNLHLNALNSSAVVVVKIMK